MHPYCTAVSPCIVELLCNLNSAMPYAAREVKVACLCTEPMLACWSIGLNNLVLIHSRLSEEEYLDTWQVKDDTEQVVFAALRPDS